MGKCEFFLQGICGLTSLWPRTLDMERCVYATFLFEILHVFIIFMPPETLSTKTGIYMHVSRGQRAMEAP